MIGAIIAAPVGPVGILCVNRTLSSGRMAGFVSGLGAVTGDGFYAAVAAYGVRVITMFLSDNRAWFTVAGAFFLAVIGIRVISSGTDMPGETAKKASFAEYYFSALMVSFTNPVTVVVFGAVFAVLGLGEKGTGSAHSTAMVAGVVTGAAAAWFILSGIVDLFKARFRISYLRAFNRFSGAVLIGFSLIVFMSIFGSAGK